MYCLILRCFVFFCQKLGVKNMFPPSKRSLVFKTCLEDVFNTSSTKQFFVFQDVLRTSFEDILQDVVKTSSRRYGRRKVVTLKASSRRLGDKQNVYWGYLYTNLNLYLTNLYLTNLYQTNLCRIENALIRTQ